MSSDARGGSVCDLKIVSTSSSLLDNVIQPGIVRYASLQSTEKTDNWAIRTGYELYGLYRCHSFNEVGYYLEINLGIDLCYQ
jgi:hypothetical protein